jgi:hypothetical protein
MKQFVLTLLMTSMAVLFASADTVVDPIRSYAAFHALSSGRIIYQWKVDLNNDGRKEVLLATKLTPEESAQEQRENNWNAQSPTVCDFTVYIPNHNGAGYIESKGVEENGGLAIVAVSIDTSHCFAGNITQLNRWGLVTVDIEPAGRKNPAVATIKAYTLEDYHLKVTILARYNPDKESNPIFEQYLSESKRTKVQLQEVKP